MKNYQTSQIELRSGIHTYCDVGDADRTLLLLHGFSFRQGMYPLMDALKSDYRVILPDLPFSTRNDFRKPHSLENYVDYLLDFVKEVGLKNVSIFGNSVGGTLGLMCCLESPQQFDRLVVRCPLWSSKQLPNYMQSKLLVDLHGYLSWNRFLALKMVDIFYRMSARMSPVDGNQADHYAADKSQSPIPYTEGRIDPVLLSSFLGQLVQVEIGDRLSSISNRTLILWGELDKFIQSRWGEYLNQRLPASQFMEMAGEYHNIATSKPGTLAKIISEFVGSHQ
jgi:pimeloyl-ACP methyl ester carboxylesterase